MVTGVRVVLPRVASSGWPRRTMKPARISLIVSVLRSASGGMLRASTTSASSVRARNCATCRSDAPRAMLTCTFGCCRAMYVRKGVISTAPGPDPRPTRMLPTSALCAKSTARRSSPASSTSRRARATTVKPTGVSSTFFPMRSKRRAPTSSSSVWMLRLRADCVRCVCTAARLNERVSATARKCSICRRFKACSWHSHVGSLQTLNQRGGLRPQIHSRKSS